MNFDFLKKCDEDIRNGQGKQILELILNIPKKNIPRKHLSQVGTLLNRVGGSMYALKLLYPYIRGSYYDLGTDKEKSTYSQSLINVGAQREGVQLLRELKSKDPSHLLTESFYFFKSWNYDLALPLVLRYIEEIEDDYMKIVGQINLASIYIFQSKFDLALQVLLEINKNENKEIKLLKGYVYELIGQVYFHTCNFDQSLDFLNRSIHTLKTSNQKALLYPKKWLALLELKRDQNPTKIESIKQLAKNAKDFETLRDIDYWKGLITKDKQLLSNVYFKTPFTAFKKRIPNNLVNKNWFWNKDLGSKPFIDLFGHDIPMCFELTSQLFCYLLSDGYKPMGIGSIHSHLFTNDYYNPSTTPDRVYQIISRLNKILDKKFSYKVECLDKSYRINGSHINNFNFRLNKNSTHLLTHPINVFIEQIKNITDDKFFSAQQLAEYFQVSQRTANRWIKLIPTEQIGKGRNTKFTLKAS